MQDPPFYCKWFVSIDNSVRRPLLLKSVLHSLSADAIKNVMAYDPIQPTQTRPDGYPVEACA